MECIEARKYLSEHIDGRLDTQVLKGLEEHLLSCAGCREELSLLKALISDMGGLEPVHAPTDFLERLHDRMDSGFGFARLMRTFFVPLKIKIPLELVTAAAMAVLVFSIWNIQQREPEIMPFPTAKKHERVSEETGPPLPKLTFTGIKLSFIGLRPALHFGGNPFEPSFLPVCPPVKTTLSFMIGQVQIVSVIAGNPGFPVAHITIPANEIHGVSKIILVGAPIARISLVFFPRCVQRLSIP